MEKKNFDFEARRLQKEEELYLMLLALYNVADLEKETSQDKGMFVLTRRTLIEILYYQGKALAEIFDTAIPEHLLDVVRGMEDNIIGVLEEEGIKVSLNDSAKKEDGKEAEHGDDNQH